MSEDTKPPEAGNEMRSHLISIAASLARFQHVELSEMDQQDLPLFGDYARRLKKIADSLYQPILIKVVDAPVEIHMNELESLRQRIDQLEREKRGIGPDDQYA
jgi:hypothetical protein